MDAIIIPMLIIPTMDFRLELSANQKSWLQNHGYTLHSFIARGMNAGVWLVSKHGKNYAAKMSHRKSTRVRMTEKEVLHLHLANKLSVGPRVVESDFSENILIMEYIRGKTLATWLNENNSKKLLKIVLKKVFGQAKKLDEGKLDHGQLGGKLHNILVDAKNNPHIIDFEKASYVRKPRNVNALKHVLLSGHTGFSTRVREALSPEEISKLI
jgi:putative serine/threonine protein kinase